MPLPHGRQYDDFPDPFERGVYRVCIRTPEGYPLMIAVDSRGRTVKSLVIKDLVTVEAADRILADYLDAVDPVPTLCLVRGGER